MSSSPASLTSPCCANCRHWLALNASLRASPTGECRRRAPLTDWRWPRTYADGHCAEWAAVVVAGEAGDCQKKHAARGEATPTGRDARATPEAGGTPAPQQEAAEPSLLSLDTESGDAPPSASAHAGAGADRGTGNRPRRRVSGGQA